MMKIPHSIRIYWKNILAIAGFYFLFRLVFHIIFHEEAGQATLSDILQSLLTGLRFDFRLAASISLPFLIFISFRETFVNKHLKFWLFFFNIAYFIFFAFYAVDIGYYAYLHSRLNITALQLLNNIPIALGMVWQSYNVPLICIGVLIAFAPIILFNKSFIFCSGESSSKKKWPWLIATYFFSILLMHGSLNQYPLRWSDAYFSSNAYVSQLTLNPILFFVDTAFSTDTSFDKEKTKFYYPSIANYLGVQQKDSQQLNFHRPLSVTQDIPRSFNVVYIVMESFAAYKTGRFGNPLKPSPYFDKISNNSVMFDHFYTPTEGTARSLFCALTGIPDINAESTSSRNPQVINQQTLLNALEDHDKFYFIGGSASWGNIRGVYKNNVDDLKMFEDKDFQLHGTDVWGLSDLDLFKEAARILTSVDSKKPFFALIQSASFHRPYTIPENKDDFKIENKSDKELSEAGFRSNEEYNSFRFSDYALGVFFEKIKDSPMAKNTLFVVHGDHGLPHNDAAHLSAGYKHFGLNRFHVPLIFYAPAVLKPEVRKDIGFEPDVMATIVGATGHEAINTTLGRNLFATANEKPFAFSYVYYSSPLELFLYDDQHILVATPKDIKGLYDYTSDGFEKDLRADNSEKFSKMSELVHGLYESSRYLLHHNPKLNSRK